MTSTDKLPCTTAFLLARCELCGACQEWTGARVAGRYPVIKLKVPGTDGAQVSKQFYVRHLMYWATQGKRPPPLGRTLLTMTCGNDRCINPRHMAVRLKAVVNAETAAAGHFRTPAFRAKVAAGRRRASKLSDASVAQIRASDLPPAELARLHGISETYVYMLLRNAFRVDFSSPFAGLLC